MGGRQFDHKGRRKRNAKAAFREQGAQSRRAKQGKKDTEPASGMLGFVSGNFWSPSGTITYRVEPPAELPPLPIRHTKETVLAYRGWRLVWRGGEPYLQSITAGMEWDGPTLRSGGKPPERIDGYGVSGGYITIRLLANGMPEPPRQNNWGIFCYRTPRMALELGNVDVLGEIALMDRVIAHTKGYRAETATIRKLVCTPFAFMGGDPMEGLARRYHCDVSTDFRTLLEASDGHR